MISDTQSILMYHSVVEFKKIEGLSFSTLVASIFRLYASTISDIYLHTKSSDMINKNTPGVYKKVQGQ